MPEYLCVHLGNYPLSQLREDMGAPSLAVVVEAESARKAKTKAKRVFAEYGPAGGVVTALVDATDSHDVEPDPELPPDAS